MSDPGSRRVRVLLWHVHRSWTDAFVRGVVVLHRPEELEFAARLGVPAVYVEHNAPRPYVASSEHPLAGRSGITVAHVTHFNAAMWDCGRAPVTTVPHGIPDPGPRCTGEPANTP